ncbi:MAG: hypothetical protein E6J87_01930 [Deltaproteobacteria bacterium]|nr:MAG: hypothetical protein E6J87_01930 [Deltaproteobacteria bacterium]
MKIDKRLFVVAVLLNLAVCLTGGRVLALTIEVDEFGNGIGTLGSAITNDPGPGGLPGVLTYFLPFAGAQGDVLLYDADFGTFLDVIRFNGDGTLIFYSDNVDGFDAPADTPSPPSAFYPNVAQVDETGTEAFNDAYYTPTLASPASTLPV